MIKFNKKIRDKYETLITEKYADEPKDLVEDIDVEVITEQEEVKEDKTEK